MAIPRFAAQVSQIQIPSMKNYQEEENASIAKSLNSFGASLLSISSKIFFEKQKKESDYLKLTQLGGKITSKDGVGNG